MDRPFWIRIACIAAAVLMALVVLVGAKVIGQVNTLPPLAHKLQHFLYYGTMAGLVAIALGRRWLWLALLAVPFVGLLDEWHQLRVPGRNGSVLDWMVDGAGVVTALMLYLWVTRREPAVAPAKVQP